MEKEATARRNARDAALVTLEGCASACPCVSLRYLSKDAGRLHRTAAAVAVPAPCTASLDVGRALLRGRCSPHSSAETRSLVLLPTSLPLPDGVFPPSLVLRVLSSWANDGRESD